MSSPAERLRSALLELGVEHEEISPREFLVPLRGEHKLVTNALLAVGDSSLLVEAFFMRGPDENHDGVYRLLLQRNLRTFGVHFAIDTMGDVYLTGRVPLEAITPAEIDRLLGSVLTHADEMFDPAVALGFAESIRAEKAWRDKNGLDASNLAPFLRAQD
jgi:hypothetical protein